MPGAPSASVYPRSPAVSRSIARCLTTSDAPVEGSPAHRLRMLSPAALRAFAAARISITANGGTCARAATFMGTSWRTNVAPASAHGQRARDQGQDLRGVRLGRGAEAMHRSVRHDQELLEVPGDPSGLARRVGERGQ